jgi:hypothetical protein
VHEWWWWWHRVGSGVGGGVGGGSGIVVVIADGSLGRLRLRLRELPLLRLRLSLSHSRRRRRRRHRERERRVLLLATQPTATSSSTSRLVLAVLQRLVFFSKTGEQISEVLVLRVLRSLGSFELCDPFFELWKTSLAYVDSTEPRTHITRSHGDTSNRIYSSRRREKDQERPKKRPEHRMSLTSKTCLSFLSRNARCAARFCSFRRCNRTSSFCGFCRTGPPFVDLCFGSEKWWNVSMCMETNLNVMVDGVREDRGWTVK